MLSRLHADYTVSISEFKKNPQALIDYAAGEPIAILNRNKPCAYIVPAETFEWIMDFAEDQELGSIIDERKGEKGSAVEVNVDEL
ncbi:MAG: antitoxin [Deltaproteobacteria bacterium CG_4_8_14_3_um_filter_51_11]|nr:type II toxin-antitoxin system prevent-host-death family antitoxin [bacterium]PIW00120.1 MAG: antitoxin [Deltaproteobacteria bacterium CG17_big_fil_post_rev_8_21_14_2_50_51_6]PIX20213.1 MAG: antitoxin [Deltaproteobacteria bacterium CG_4_8_14_3_um_filter_51_11]PJB39162.1 MAG: antitoxin [Deltaproteobacteria bacterium CG_4_9_14_3_um_filter_51_14]